MSRHLLSCKNPETAWSRRTSNAAQPLLCRRYYQQVFWRSKMGRKDASTIKLPVDQYRKQIEKNLLNYPFITVINSTLSTTYQLKKQLENDLELKIQCGTAEYTCLHIIT
ncbi:triple QxxK/R motif-containing protein isoform X3 [Dasypus novemcinctus]|uniref:triple QxxK/R motif-containing protein isoform X3 n=1 Tax=Dasypus novemcinctus TaxID=9361 RepID=UPI0039C8DA85